MTSLFRISPLRGHSPVPRGGDPVETGLTLIGRTMKVDRRRMRPRPVFFAGFFSPCALGNILYS